ncbi:MAG: FecR domain-containing protein [Pseudomonadota bacterium]
MSKPIQDHEMIQTITRICLLLLTSFSLLSTPEIAIAEKDVETNAKVTFLQGEARLVGKGIQKITPLKTNDILMQGDEIETGDTARIEIRLPDESYIRFGEKTRFILDSSSLNRKQKIRDISVRMILGKVWAKASKLFSGRGRFAISTRTAVAGVRGTVYRMSVNEDSSAVVKVYYGEVLVSSKEQSERQEGPQKVEGPKPIAGPHPIPGPHAVSREEWTHIVSSMQQIVIKSDGTASKPFRFSPEADEDAWVQWNKKRDEKIDAAAE